MISYAPGFDTMTHDGLPETKHRDIASAVSKIIFYVLSSRRYSLVVIIFISNWENVRDMIARYYFS